MTTRPTRRLLVLLTVSIMTAVLLTAQVASAAQFGPIVDSVARVARK